MHWCAHRSTFVMSNFYTCILHHLRQHETRISLSLFFMNRYLLCQSLIISLFSTKSISLVHHVLSIHHRLENVVYFSLSLTTHRQCITIFLRQCIYNLVASIPIWCLISSDAQLSLYGHRVNISPSSSSHSTNRPNVYVYIERDTKYFSSTLPSLSAVTISSRLIEQLSDTR